MEAGKKKKIERSRYNRKISGVCGGLADYFDMDVTFVRLIFLMMALSALIVYNASAVFVIICYFSLAVIIPAEGAVKSRKTSSSWRKMSLYRVEDEKMITGLCGGIAKALSVDPTVVRVLTAVPAIMTGIVPGFVIYLVIAWIVPSEEVALEFKRRRKERNVEADSATAPVVKTAPSGDKDRNVEMSSSENSMAVAADVVSSGNNTVTEEDAAKNISS